MKFIQLFYFRQTYETYAANKDDDAKKFWGKGDFLGYNKFSEDEETRYVNKANLRLSDLGIGKFVPIQYPWNPANSPNMCQDLGMAVNQDGVKDDKGSYPSPDCHEFLFTKQ